MIVYTKLHNIYQYYFELKNEIEDDGTCPIIDDKVKYETIRNIILINNELYMICHQDYIFNELLLLNFTKNPQITYDNGGLYVYSVDEYIIENYNYIFGVQHNDMIIDIILNMIDKTIIIYENDKLEYYLNYDIYNPNA
jgi:hypothetical protein